MFRLGCCLLFAAAALAAPVPSGTSLSEPPAVTVLLDYQRPYSQLSFRALQHQLQTTLDGTGLRLDVRERSTAAPHEQFGDVVMFTMKGTCSMRALPVGALSDERGPLAMAYSSNGSVLPFGEVECDRVRESLERIIGKTDGRRFQAAYGVALGMVMAHELYHMLGHSARHTRQGVTKESLSAQELLEGSLSLPEIARRAMQKSPAIE